MPIPILQSPPRFITHAGSVLLIISITIAVHPLILSYPIAPGLDNSWPIAIQLALKNKLAFGEDIIFTYGPLGYLATRCPIGLSRLTVFIFDLFVVANLIYILYRPLRRLTILELMIAISALIFSNDLFSVDVVPLLYIIMGYYLIKNLQEQNPWEIAIAAILSLILFFVKLNFGLFSILIFLLFTSYLFAFSKKIRKRIYASMALYLIVFFASCSLLRVKLIEYILNSIEIVRGYPGAMYNAISGGDVIYLIVSIILIALIAGLLLIHLIFFLRETGWTFNKVDLRELFRICFTGFFIASTCYILFKQAYTRPDLGHFPTFFKFIIPLMSLLLLNGTFPFPQILRSSIMVSLTVVTFVIQTSYTSGFIEHGKRKYKHVVAYYKDLLVPSEPEPGDGNLSKTVRDIIGNESVDVIPTEVSLAYFNNLNYKPRPVFQSYSAYTEKLDRKNAESYQGSSGPTFIIASPGSIDYRYFFWDESKTKFEILRSYNAVLVEDNFILYKKRERPLEFKVLQQDTSKMELGKFKDVNTFQGLTYARIKIEYNLYGKLRSFLYQPPDLRVTFLLKNGQEFTYRAVNNIISAGVLINKYIPENNNDILSFHLSQGEVANEVQKIKFDTEHRNMFKREILVETTDILLNHPENYALEQQFNELRYAKVEDVINQSIDKVTLKENSVEITGWAFLKDRDYKNLQTSVILSSKNEIIVSQCESILRPDVTQNYSKSNLNLDPSGFIAMIDRNLFKKGGSYDVLLSIADDQGNIISTTDCHMKIDVPLK